jgi:hypothetical protein
MGIPRFQISTRYYKPFFPTLHKAKCYTNIRKVFDKKVNIAIFSEKKLFYAFWLRKKHFLAFSFMEHVRFNY